MIDSQFQQWMQNIQNMISGANAGARRAIEAAAQSQAEVQQLRDTHAQHAQQLQYLNGVMQNLKISKSGTGASGDSPAQVGRPDMLAIEEIPGRRVPYDLTVQIAVPNAQTSPLQGTYTISMDGPFVAVARYATFISTHTFQVTDETNVQRYTGRSWGRQRPISSVTDLMDAMNGWFDGDVNALSGDCSDDDGPETAVLSRPTNRSPFRTMGFDGWIQVKSSVYPRQNQQVPTSLWAPGFNQLLQLPVLDYWEKGEVIEFDVSPLHTNNPSAGNVQTLFGSMPYLAGQYDGHEGVMYPSWECGRSVADTITRSPDGVLVLGFMGFRILQPPGVRMR
jgi:hypothetical protein